MAECLVSFGKPKVARGNKVVAFVVIKNCSYNFLLKVVITALHGTQTRSSDDNSVCPSVRLSVNGVDCDKTEEKSVQIFILYERSFRFNFCS